MAEKKTKPAKAKKEAKPKVAAKTEKKPAKKAPAPKKPVPTPEPKPEKKAEKKEAKPAEAKPAETKPAEKKVIKKEPSSLARDFLAFDKWDTKGIIVLDLGLKKYINLSPRIVPRSQGRFTEKQFWKSQKPIIERFMNKLMVSGHRGKKHVRTSHHQTGKAAKIYNLTRQTFELVEKKTQKNPIEILIRAIEKGSPKEGIATIEYGGVRYPKAVDLAPQRRIDLALRWMTQGAHAASAAGKNKKFMRETLANEIIATMEGDQSKSTCVQKKIELERQAAASR